MHFHEPVRVDRVPKISRLIWSGQPGRLGAIVLLSVLGSVFGLVAPFLQKNFVDGLALGNPMWNWLILALFAMLMAQWLSTGALALGVKAALNRQQAMSELLYKKILSLRTDQTLGSTVGEAVSIYAQDVPGATAFLDQTLPLGLAVVLPFVVAPWVIESVIGIPLWHSYVSLVALLLVSVSLSLRQARFFQKFKELAAVRIGFVNEWIQNIRLLRILGWVRSFEAKIFESREEETINRVRMVTNGQIMGAFGSSVNFALTIVGIAALVTHKGQAATPGDYFAILWVYGVLLAKPFRQVPWLFTFSFDAWTSIQRLERFMNRSRESLFDFEIRRQGQVRTDAVGLDVHDLSLEIEGHRILDSISFKIEPGEFVAIVGEVGSGKSLLLLSLLGETGANIKSLMAGGRELAQARSADRRAFFAFVPQDGFVMSSSLRENVVFRYGADGSDDVRVRSALTAAQFESAREGVGQDLSAQIGERGVNLSGGQKQRVTLARSVFLSRPIVLIDDALSAVDVDTEKKLMASLFKGEWKTKTRVLVTHRFSALDQVDRVFFLKHGRLAAVGPYRDLVQTDESFRAHVQGAL